MGLLTAREASRLLAVLVLVQRGGERGVRDGGWGEI